ncbi:MAG: hypothetical protein ACW96M_01605, partial [Candidatus Thorarchaeota archaeon]
MIDGLVKRYRTILKVGMLLVTLSFFVGIWRLFNQVAIEQYHLLGDTLSEAYLIVEAVEAVLHAYAEIVPLFGLGILKLGIGFAIATIVM